GRTAAGSARRQATRRRREAPTPGATEAFSEIRAGRAAQSDRPSLYLLHDADERHVAELLSRVETVTDDEQVGEREPQVLDGDARPQARRFVQQRADLHGRGVPRRQ